MNTNKSMKQSQPLLPTTIHIPNRSSNPKPNTSPEAMIPTSLHRAGARGTSILSMRVEATLSAVAEWSLEARNRPPFAPFSLLVSQPREGRDQERVELLN